MNEKNAMGVGSPQMDELRHKAEQRVRNKNVTPVEAVSEVDACALVHDLHVHQIEPEMQNEELQHAYVAAQEASENYYDLFDFAPVGYFLWDAEGRILAVNLAGAALLGLNRKAMIETPFGQFVAQDNRPAFADFCNRVLTTGLQQNCEIKLLCAGQAVYALVEGIAAPNHQGQGKLCRAAVIDITRRRFLEESLRDAHAMLEIRAAELARTLEQLQEEVQQRIETEASLERERQTLQDLLQAGDHERRLIGYEIHDGLAQHLAAATMHLQAAENSRTQDPIRAAEAYAAGMVLVGEGLKEARRLISNVRPPILDEEGVAAGIANLVDYHHQCPGAPDIEFHSDAELPRLHPVVENAIYRIAQEGLTNACKYARTKRIRIDLVQQGNQSVRIEIRDCGVGFDPATEKKECFGLQGIRERARLLGGHTVIESALGQGTRIVAELPLVLPLTAESGEP
jgi:PAS domain S-box-containing protein